MNDQILSEGCVLDDRYKIKKVIAEGGMSIVYEVEDMRLGGSMALKQMRELVADAAQQEILIGQFKREAELLSQLCHMNLPKVTDHFVFEGRRFLVEELIEGKTLEALMEERAPRAESEVIEWASQICDALLYLHGQQIVYRDLKPSNCIVTTQGAVKLIDFGLVRFFSIGKPKDTVIMGTPGYAAPEQYGQEQTDPRSDVFSLGALLHHLLTGHDPTRTPFIFPDARDLNPAISEECEQVLVKALSIEPSRRFQRIEEMKGALRGERTIMDEAETFSYGNEPPRKLQYTLSSLASVAGCAFGVFLLPSQTILAMFAIAYSPFFIWLGIKEYRQKSFNATVQITANEQGLYYRDGLSRFFARWNEVKSLAFSNDRFSGRRKADVETEKGSFSFMASPEREGRSFLPPSPLQNAERLCHIIITEGRLRILQPGSEVYGRK
ncbi:MAG: serine/threonine-protein kinase [Candidatus Eremiobacteraeota bacterium]|nr:serine/threonine-protein kinase [Candidatus Eremiobacteraeota bacterium]